MTLGNNQNKVHKLQKKTIFCSVTKRLNKLANLWNCDRLMLLSALSIG